MTELEKELARIGLVLPPAEVRALAQLTTAAEFEKTLFYGGWVSSRNEAHAVLLTLKKRAQRRERHDRPPMEQKLTAPQSKGQENDNKEQ